MRARESRSTGTPRGWERPPFRLCGFVAILFMVLMTAVAVGTWSGRASCTAGESSGGGLASRRRKVLETAAQPDQSMGGTEGLLAAQREQQEREQQGRPYPRYSTHTCIGQKFDDEWPMATCKFDNICINSTTLKFEYYVDPDLPDAPVTYGQDGRPYYEFPDTLLHPGHWIEEKTTHWRPRVVRRKFPPPGPRVKWAPAPQALLQVFPVRFVYNFGHAIFDVLTPLFNMQQLFNIYTPNAQVLILWAQGGSKKKLRNRMHSTFNPWQPEASLLRLTWDWDATFLKNITQDVLGDRRGGLVCFKTVLAGTGHLSRRMSRLDALPYRQAAVRHIGLVELPQRVPVITVLSKQGRRMIENTPQIVELLRRRYPAARVGVFDFGDRPDLTVRDQVKLMSDTSVLISPCGGLATVLTFMRPQTTAIVMNFYHTIKQRSVNMEDQYYRFINYLDIQYFPVTLDEYQNTHDRPGCELSPDGEGWADGFNLGRHSKSGALVNCNLRIQGRGLKRLINMVDNALLRWAANTGHYEAVEPLMRRQPPGLGRGAGGTAAVSAGSGSAGGATAEAAAGATAQVPAGGEVLRL